MLQKYRYLCALAKEQHFGRAARACHVSQPTLSNGLRQLEEDLGQPLIERGQKYMGMTPAGLKVLESARRMLDEQERLLMSLKAGTKGLSGVLRIGIIPSALPSLAILIKKFTQMYPDVRFSIQAMSSQKIRESFESFDLDLALTYLDNLKPASFETVALYDERFYFLAPKNLLSKDIKSMTWAQAAQHPLCLLSGNMQNRLRIDAAFLEVGAVVVPRVETDSLINLYTNVCHGISCAIISHQLLKLSQFDEGISGVPLKEPTVLQRIGLVTALRERSSLIAQAFIKMVMNHDFSKELEA